MRCLLVIETAGHVAVVDHDTGIRFRFEELPTVATTPLPPGPPPPTRTAAWSAAGQWTAWSRRPGPDGAAAVVLHDEDTEFNRVIAPADATHLAPSPCGRFLGHCSPGPLGTELAVSDVRTGALRVVERGDPLAWSWSPDGAWLAVQVGERVLAVPMGEGTPALLSERADPSGPPCWTADGSVVLAADGMLQRHGPDGTVTPLARREPTAGPARFAFDPDGRRLAWTGAPAAPHGLAVTDLLTAVTTVASAGTAAGFCWSPDGRGLAVLEPAGDEMLRWSFPDGDAPVSLPAFRPTDTWRADVLPHFDQHLTGHAVWAADGRSLVVPARGDGGTGLALTQPRPGHDHEHRRPVTGVELAWWAD